MDVNLWGIVLTSGLTVLTGTTVAVLGQIVTRFFLEPLQEFQKTIGDVADTLIYYSNVYCNPGSVRPELMDEACNHLRQKAGLLRIRAQAVRGNDWIAARGWVPPLGDVYEAARDMIFLSNSVHRGEALPNYQVHRKVLRLLRQPPEPGQFPEPDPEPPRESP